LEWRRPAVWVARWRMGCVVPIADKVGGKATTESTIVATCEGSVMVET
jgi:hypothetical protein